MDSQGHTTPASRQALREYLWNRRLTGSVQQATTSLALNDLDEAMRLLRGVNHPSAAWAEEVEVFLARTDSRSDVNPQSPLPDLSNYV